MDSHFAEAQDKDIMSNLPYLVPQQALLQPLVLEPVLAESPTPESRRLPSVRIVEEPASTSMRFRYECETSEGRSAGSVPGAHSTPQCRTFPTIEIVGYTGTVCVMISCVTDEQPYSAHPHQLVGRDCHMGIFKAFMEIEPGKPFIVFNNLGIQCVRKKDVKKSLALRKRLRVGPCDSQQPPARIKLNTLKLCFQVFLVSKANGIGEDQLTPLRAVVTKNTISDKKAMNELVIHKLSHCSASVAGGQDMILLCDKVPKDDIKIQFYETQDGVIVWKENAPFLPINVHKQVAINFRTPKYKDQNIDQPVKVYVMLHNPKTKTRSKPRPFELRPLNADVAELKRSRVNGENECSCLLKRLQQTFRENPELLSSFIMSSGPQTSSTSQPSQTPQTATVSPMTLQPQPTPAPHVAPIPQHLAPAAPIASTSRMASVHQMIPVPQMAPGSQRASLPQITSITQTSSNIFASGASNLLSTSAANIIPNIANDHYNSTYDDILMTSLIQGSMPDSAYLQQMQDVDDVLQMQIEAMTDSFSKYCELVLKQHTQE